MLRFGDFYSFARPINNKSVKIINDIRFRVFILNIVSMGMIVIIRRNSLSKKNNEISLWIIFSAMISQFGVTISSTLLVNFLDNKSCFLS